MYASTIEVKVVEPGVFLLVKDEGVWVKLQ